MTVASTADMKTVERRSCGTDPLPREEPAIYIGHLTGGAMGNGGLAFNADITPLLQNGTTLTINAVAVDSGQPVSFAISLNAFGGALARTAELSAD